MKKLVFLVLMFLFISNVHAESVSLDNIVDVINNGVVSEEFKNNKLSEVIPKTNTKLWNEVSIVATKVDNGIDIIYTYSGSSIESGKIEAFVLDDGKTLQSKISYKKDDDYKFENEIELHNLLVYWTIEASEGFEVIKQYRTEDYISLFNIVFDKCYRKEMHACRTYVSNYGDYEYTSDVELNEGATEYVIDYLKEEKRSENNKRMLVIIAGVGVILLVIFLIAKLCETPNNKRKK